VENGYIAYNFSHFATYLPKIIRVDGNLTDKVLTETILHSCFWATVYIHVLYIHTTDSLV